MHRLRSGGNRLLGAPRPVAGGSGQIGRPGALGAAWRGQAGLKPGAPESSRNARPEPFALRRRSKPDAPSRSPRSGARVRAGRTGRQAPCKPCLASRPGAVASGWNGGPRVGPGPGPDSSRALFRARRRVRLSVRVRGGSDPRGPRESTPIKPLERGLGMQIAPACVRCAPVWAKSPIPGADSAVTGPGARGHGLRAIERSAMARYTLAWGQDLPARRTGWRPRAGMLSRGPGDAARQGPMRGRAFRHRRAPGLRGGPSWRRCPAGPDPRPVLPRGAGLYAAGMWPDDPPKVGATPRRCAS